MDTKRCFSVVSITIVLGLMLAACGDSEDGSGATDTQNCWAISSHEPVSLEDVDRDSLRGTSLTLVAYDSFWVSEGVFEAFESETGISVEVLTSADTGSMVSQAVLNAGNPVADVMWGIDNTFLCRALVNDVFVPYTSSRLDEVDPSLVLDPQHRVTPVDYSDLCVNYRSDKLDELGLRPPSGLDDLRSPAYASTFVTENPETSAPGMGLLLSSIALYGDPGWEEFWTDLAAGGIAVEAGWSEAYTDRFAPDGDRAMVMSYATSPVYELLFSEIDRDTPPTAALLDACFRSIEFAGILAGTDHPQASAVLVDFLLSPTMQSDLPLSMFVFPATSTADVPSEFLEHASVPADPFTLAPDEIEENRDRWTERWTDIVLR
jgi:thiamine transport system substrate-binding protein